jgi:DNA-binding transcriptional LysR family regulator
MHLVHESRKLPADLDAMALFVRIVDHGSLSAASRALGVPKATLSRRLAELERSLGTALLRRSTRAQSLTPAGRALHERVAALLVEAERAAGDIRVASEEPAGLVRVSAAVGFGQIVLVPILARFLESVPQVRVELSLTDDFVRIVEGGFDLAFRMGPLDESDMLSRRLARVERSVFASPAYLKAHGTPRTIDDLKRHRLLVSHPRHDTWRFDTERGPRDVRVRWHMAAGDMMSLTEATRLGIGVSLLPAYVAAPSVARHELVAIDVGASPTAGEAAAVFPRAPTPPAAVRRLLDFTIAELSASPFFAARRTARRPFQR